MPEILSKLIGTTLLLLISSLILMISDPPEIIERGACWTFVGSLVSALLFVLILIWFS